MINLLLLTAITLFFLYAFYDQFFMDWWKGKSQLKVRLKKQAKIDALIFIALIAIVIYQVSNIAPFTLFLFAFLVVLIAYSAFWRSPVLLLKQQGFFFGNLYFPYSKIQNVNLTEDHIFVIDLKSGKRLLARLEEPTDREKLVNFFGGWK